MIRRDRNGIAVLDSVHFTVTREKLANYRSKSKGQYICQFNMRPFNSVAGLSKLDGIRVSK